MAALNIDQLVPPPPASADEAQDNERRFHDMIASLPTAIYTTDAQGRLTHFNPACVAFSGRTPQLGSDHWCVTWKLFYPDGRPMPHDECPMALALRERRAVRGEEAIAERPDGTRIWFEPYPTPLFDESGELVGGINMLVDITERKRAEVLLAAEKKSLELLAQGESLESVLQYLIETVEEQSGGRVVCSIALVNDAATHFTSGVGARLPDSYHQLLPGLAVATNIGTCCRTILTGKPVFVPDVTADPQWARFAAIVAPLGYRAVWSTAIHNARGKILGTFANFSRDTGNPVEPDIRFIDAISRTAALIIERKQTEERLHIRARQQKAIAQIGEFALAHCVQEAFDYATAAVAENLGVEYCKVLELLPGGEAVLLRSGVGWKPGLVGNATVDTGLNSQAGFTLVSDSPVVVADLRTESRFSGPSLLIEHGVVSGMSCVIRRPGGVAWGVLGTHCRRRVDFTQDDVNFLVAVANVLGNAVERNLADQKLQQALAARTDEVVQSQRRLATSQRMAAVGTLAAGLAHDMSNLLLPLGAQLELLMARKDIEPKVHEHLGVIGAMLEQLRGLARNLSLFSRDPDKEGIVGHTDIAQWHSAVHKLLDASVGNQIIMEWDCPAGLPPVAISPHRLTQIVQNIVHNARDAVLAVPRRSDRPRILVQARRGADPDGAELVHLAVRDNGIGMDDETRRRCIEPFFTTRDRPREHGGAGSGLGLALVHQIIERAGGTMTIESEPGRGTTITLALPAARS